MENADERFSRSRIRAPRLLNQEVGFSLLGAMIGGALLSLLAMMMAEMFNHQSRAIQGLRTASSRDQLLARVARLSGNGTALTNSANQAPAGSPFKRCALGTGGNCVENTDVPFTLYDVQGNTPLSNPWGTNPPTVLFDVNGAPCGSTISAHCPIAVFTAFTPKCSSTSPCPQAKTITVRYRIEQVFNGVIQGGTPLRTLEGSIASSVPFDASASGTPDRIAKWITGFQLGDSGITETGSGFVGIGTTSPGTLLEVGPGSAWTTANWARSVKIGSPTVGSAIELDAGPSLKYGVGASVNFGAPGGAFAIFRSNGETSGSTATYDLVISGSGDIGVGTANPAAKLDVNGGIRIGSTTSCLAGTQRYNSSGNGSMEFCDNTGNWAAMGGASPPGTVCGYQTGACGVNLMGPACNGVSPGCGSCPGGYSLQHWMVSFGNGHLYFCVKN